jgi:MFS family permease
VTPAGVPSTASALAITLWLNLVMVLASASFLAVPILAPAIAADRSLPTGFVGLYSGSLWAASLLTSIAAGGLIARLGAWRVAQLSLLLCVLGLLSASAGSLAGVAMAALLIGLGNGAETPASSQLLVRSVPQDRRAAYFSLKQTGVQIGGMGGAVALPLIAGLYGWRVALWVVAAVVVAMLVALERPRSRFADLARATPTARSSFRVALAELARHRLLRRLAVGAATFGATQVCLNSFMVSYAVAERGATLAQAGVLLAVAQGGGLTGRLLWGWLVSRRRNALSMLRALGAAMAACSLAVGAFGDTAPAWLMLPLCFGFGLTASGWNGVFLAEVAHQVPVERVGAATGAIMVLMTLGLVIGPLAFASIRATLSFGAAFVALGVIAAAGTFVLPVAVTARSPREQGRGRG